MAVCRDGTTREQLQSLAPDFRSLKEACQCSGVFAIMVTAAGGPCVMLCALACQTNIWPSGDLVSPELMDGRSAASGQVDRSHILHQHVRQCMSWCMSCSSVRACILVIRKAGCLCAHVCLLLRPYRCYKDGRGSVYIVDARLFEQRQPILPTWRSHCLAFWLSPSLYT